MTQQATPYVSGIPDPGGASVQYDLRYERVPGAPIVFTLATVADDISPWGAAPAQRDIQLRSFWPTESFLSSAVYSTVARDAAFSWTLEGPPQTVKRVQDLLHTAGEGEGWQQFIMQVRTDLLTQDNGAFIEIIRDGARETDPVTGLAHLDAARCRRTGVREWPVVYLDLMGTMHKLRPWQVIAWSEWPSPVESMFGIGLCAVSRVLRMAQFLRDVSIFQREKVGGRNPAAMWLVNGVSTKYIEDIVKSAQMNADNRGDVRYMLPIILAALDPTATIDAKKIDLASLPDNFDYEVTMKWYITNLAMAFGADYQDFAPLPGGNLGSSAQSMILHQKSRGKGPALFMKQMEYLFNFHGILPRTVTFRYDEQDAAADAEQAELRKLRADADLIYIQTGVLTPAAVRQRLLDDGEISVEVFEAIQQTQDLTANVIGEDDERSEAELPTGQPNTGALGTPIPTPPAATQSATTATKDAEASDFAQAERDGWEADYRAKMERILRTAFAPLKRAILDAGGSKGLRSLLGAKEDDDVVMQARVQAALEDPAWWQAFRNGMVDGASSTFRLVATGAAQFNADLGLPVDMMGINQAVLDLTRTYTDQWWAEIDTATRTAMRSALVNWQEGKLGAQGLPDLVDSLTPWFGEVRAQRIAATEVTRMFDIGNRLAMEDAGIEKVEFQTVRDEWVCPQCGPLNGQRFLLNEAPRPPLHVNCRCAVVPTANDQLIGVA